MKLVKHVQCGLLVEHIVTDYVSVVAHQFNLPGKMEYRLYLLNVVLTVTQVPVIRIHILGCK
jgi:hypothetical protein